MAIAAPDSGFGARELVLWGNDGALWHGSLVTGVDPGGVAPPACPCGTHEGQECCATQVEGTACGDPGTVCRLSVDDFYCVACGHIGQPCCEAQSIQWDGSCTDPRSLCLLRAPNQYQSACVQCGGFEERACMEGRPCDAIVGVGEVRFDSNERFCKSCGREWQPACLRNGVQTCDEGVLVHNDQLGQWECRVWHPPPPPPPPPRCGHQFEPCCPTGPQCTEGGTVCLPPPPSNRGAGPTCGLSPPRRLDSADLGFGSDGAPWITDWPLLANTSFVLYWQVCNFGNQRSGDFVDLVLAMRQEPHEQTANTTEDEENLDPGECRWTFHSFPQGFPAGDYNVTVTVNGAVRPPDTLPWYIEWNFSNNTAFLGLHVQ